MLIAFYQNTQCHVPEEGNLQVLGHCIVIGSYDADVLSCRQCNDCAFVFQLMKIEEGLLNGEVLFHEFIEKTDEEKLLIQKTREEKRFVLRFLETAVPVWTAGLEKCLDTIAALFAYWRSA
jgi:hypothetical protein